MFCAYCGRDIDPGASRVEQERLPLEEGERLSVDIYHSDCFQIVFGRAAREEEVGRG